MVKPIKYAQKASHGVSVRRAGKNKATKLRKSITAGTVVILLTGQFKGCRVVVLKQLASGMLLVTGPYAVNGVPLKRVNQRYVIATSLKMDVGSIDTASVTDEWFKRESPNVRKVKDEEGFFAKSSEKKAVSSEKKAVQKKVDTGILAAIKKDKVLGKYMKSKFALTSGMKPHAMSF